MTDDLEIKDLKYISRNGWVRIGILNEIRIYPMETGHGFNVSKAICTKNGLQSFSLTTKNPKSQSEFRYFDRVFVPFKYTENGYSILNNPLVAQCKNKVAFRKAQKIATRIDGGWRSKIDYLGETVQLFDINCHLKHPTEGKIGEIGYIPQEGRKKSLSRYRETKYKNSKGNIFLSHFYPYSLINTTSLDLLKEENGGSQNILTVEKFSPNFVIEANQPYCEDQIVDLKIGEEAHFSNIVPCTHHLKECDYDAARKAKQTELLKNLKKTRSLQTVHPYLSMSSKLPVLGINLEILHSGEIHLYDAVYAKFRDIPFEDVDNREVSDMEVDDKNM